MEMSKVQDRDEQGSAWRLPGFRMEMSRVQDRDE